MVPVAALSTVVKLSGPYISVLRRILGREMSSPHGVEGQADLGGEGLLEAVAGANALGVGAEGARGVATSGCGAPGW